MDSTPILTSAQTSGTELTPIAAMRIENKNVYNGLSFSWLRIQVLQPATFRNSLSSALLEIASPFS